MSTSTDRQARGFRVTKRDLDLVWWLGRVRLARVEQVQARFGMARSKAYGRLQGLCELGLVVHERRIPGPGAYLATRTGLRAVDLDLSAATVSLATLEHDLAVAAVVAELESRDAKLEVVTEREMREEHRLADGRRYAPRIHEPGRSRSGHHWPDLAIHYGDGRWLAVEVELTTKRAERTAAILAAYRHGMGINGLWGVLYLAPTERDVDRLKKLAISAGLGPRRNQSGNASSVDALHGDVWFLAAGIGAIDGLANRLADVEAQHAAAAGERKRRRAEQAERARAARERRFRVDGGLG